ncbi:MAG: tRNA uridine-5-carboxymethylaminomethyl(34) synthesis GTPase MnmE [Pyrinomonadaceae bacterium]
MHSTIVALSTPLGRSGIGVIRLSGESALEITRRLVRDENFKPEPRRAYLKKVYDSEIVTEAIDSALVTFFKSPASFTGEDVIEISGHGSPILLRQIIDTALKYDARLARAGEFTLRALANGQLNLAQAEAIRDLIDAQTIASARLAQRQLGGELSNQLQPLKDKLLNVIVILESALEFVEDDLPDIATERIKTSLLEINIELGKLADTFRAGRLLREGLRVALVGRPNVGKSSLFNALLGHDRAIVTEIAGTTRDQLHESLNIKGIPVALIDTAGVRETVDTVEKIGVARTKQAISDADFVVVILDASSKLTGEDCEVLAATSEAPRVIALNKTDLNANFDSTLLQKNAKIVSISAKTGFNLEELQNQIVAPFAPTDVETSGFLISDARHHDLLRRAQLEIENSLPLLEAKMSEEIVLVGLHNALRFLGEVTGETTSEDILTRIFETFCIGK